MTRRNKKKSPVALDETLETVEERLPEPELAPVFIPAPTPPPKPARAKPEPVFSFDRYFASLGKPIHWKAGMRAWLSRRAAKGKRTVAEWNRQFIDY